MVYMSAQGGSSVKKIIRGSDRDNMVTKFKYICDLVTDKRKVRELASWALDNSISGIIVGVEGLYGVAYVKILP
jgi:hypothetical protein